MFDSYVVLNRQNEKKKRKQKRAILKICSDSDEFVNRYVGRVLN